MVLCGWEEIVGLAAMHHRQARHFVPIVAARRQFVRRAGRQSCQCGQAIIDLSTQGLKDLKREMITPLTLRRGKAPFTLQYIY